MSIKNTYSINLTTLFISAFVVSCGGSPSESSSSNNTNNQNVQPNTTSTSNSGPQIDEPVEISSSNWYVSRGLNRAVAVTTTAYSPGNHTWSVTVTDDSISENDHLQVYLDTDNNAATGYQFDNEAWANKSGADYLIEDDILFESTASDDTWSWKYLLPVDITRTNNQIKITVPVSRFSGLCNSYNIGTIGMSPDWDIETFYPLSNEMAAKSITYCDGEVNNTKPVISLEDATPINLALNASFEIPSASAYDEEDGDISSEIQSSSNVNTAQAGTYEITYSVSDSGNLAATPVKRLVIVRDNSSTGFVIDGDSADWTSIPALSQSNGGTLKVTDDEVNLYILIDSTTLGSNTQILIDTDNNATTGTAIHGNGIDFMVENELLSKYIGLTVNEWAWDYGFVNIQFVKNQNTIEMAIPKASLGNFADKIHVGFKSLDADWTTGYSIPSNVDSIAYNLLHGSGQTQQDLQVNADTASTNYATPITVNVLGNDTEQLGYILQISQFSAPSNGSAEIINSEILYTPSSSFSGTDTFTYTVNDGHGNSATATVTVIVGPRSNTAPVAANDSATTDNTTSVVIDVLANDTDPEGDTLTITDIRNPAHGLVEIVNQKVVYTPNANFIGIETFTYTISDGQLNGTATVTVIVAGSNVAPVATNDSASTNRNTSVIIDVLANDSDVDNDSLVIATTQSPSNGTVTLLSGNKIRYTPNQGFTGIEIFNYTISDGQGHTATATITVTILDTNRPPVAGEDAPSTEFNTPIQINVLANDYDPDGDSLTILSFTQPPLGVVTQVNASTLLFDPQGNIASISFTYTISDGHGGTATAGVTVASNDPNDEAHAEYPTISDENVTIHVGQSIEINVLANDFDPDGDTLNLDQVDDPDNGTTEKLGGGVVRYTPDAGFTGTDVFYYGVHDGYGHNGAGKVTVAVNLGVN